MNNPLSFRRANDKRWAGLTIVAAVIALGVSAPRAAAEGADEYLVRSCTRVGDKGRAEIPGCEQAKAKFRATYKAALARKLSAQRELVQTLLKGSDVVPADWKRACAWSVIVVMRGGAVQTTDRQAERSACGLLSPDDLEEAAGATSWIYEHIAAGGRIDESKKVPSVGLDGTAEPLD